MGRPDIAWAPVATRETLIERARLLAAVRRFFATRDVLEVETPILSQAATTDPNIHSLSGLLAVPGFAGNYYLQTSPEFAMKRLLAANSGPIFQIAKVFRAGERGRWHNPEFTLLEWYRPGYDHFELMAEVDTLLTELVGTKSCQKITYRDAFIEYAGLDPFTAPIEELHAAALGRGMEPTQSANRDLFLDFILSRAVGPQLGLDGPEFLYDYPASQAALARLSPQDPQVAERFELYLNGVELANGFHELVDAAEQAARFAADQKRRLEQDLPETPMDQRLLAALEHGMPPCAGVALGLDRLLMCKLGLRHIDAALAFPLELA